MTRERAYPGGKETLNNKMSQSWRHAISKHSLNRDQTQLQMFYANKQQPLITQKVIHMAIASRLRN